MTGVSAGDWDLKDVCFGSNPSGTDLFDQILVSVQLKRTGLSSREAQPPTSSLLNSHVSALSTGPRIEEE